MSSISKKGGNGTLQIMTTKESCACEHTLKNTWDWTFLRNRLSRILITSTTTSTADAPSINNCYPAERAFSNACWYKFWNASERCSSPKFPTPPWIAMAHFLGFSSCPTVWALCYSWEELEKTSKKAVSLFTHFFYCFTIVVENSPDFRM